MVRVPSVVIVNAHWNNRGDEAAHCALWEKIQQRYPNFKITILFKDRKGITWFPDHVAASYRSSQFESSEVEIWRAVLSRGESTQNEGLKTLIKTIVASDFIIYSPGGSVINDRFFWRKQLEYLTPFICADVYRIPIFVCSPSMGPFKTHRPIRNHLLKNTQTLCVREKISSDYLANAGIKNNVQVGIDLAFMGTFDETQKRAEYENSRDLKQFVEAKFKKTVAMTISDFSWHVHLNKKPELLKKMTREMLKFIEHLSKNQYNVLLIPQLFGNQNDSRFLRKFAVNENVFVMDEHKDAYFQQYVISKVHAVIGMRYHCNIFAAKMHIPFIAISYEEKMDGFLDIAGLSNYSVPVLDVSMKLLVQKFRQLEENYDTYQDHLREQTPKWREKAEEVFDALAKQLEKI